MASGLVDLAKQFDAFGCDQESPPFRRYLSSEAAVALLIIAKEAYFNLRTAYSRRRNFIGNWYEIGLPPFSPHLTVSGWNRDFAASSAL